MRPELETYHLIDSYLNGKLEGEALRSFEQQLQSDPAFAEEVSFQQLTNEVVVGASYDNLRSQMSKDIDKIDSSDTTKKWSLYTVAAFILITGAASIYSYSTKSVDKKEKNTKESSPTAPASVSSQTPGSVISNNSKATSSKKEFATTNPTKQNSVIYKIDSQSTVATTPLVQHAIVTQKATPDVIPAPADQPIKTDPCLNAHISADISTKPSCVNEHTGSISLTSVHGGASPYTLSLNHTTPTAIKETYAYLVSGSYSVIIRDKNGCSKEYPVSIAEKNCRKNAYVFSPDNGETWKISGSGDLNFTITLINIAGTQVYKSQLMQGEFEWQGIGQQGEYLSAGLYIYVIEYTNGQKENGQVTIVR